jgi:hypothetical protein
MTDVNVPRFGGADFGKPASHNYSCMSAFLFIHAV